MAKKVTVIQAISDRKHTAGRPRLRVCAYVRVSTGSKAQAGSYATHVEYYTRRIQENPLWEFAGIYADEAVTGTKVKGRNEFQTMIQDCEDGAIDIILTKSVTRFARNTLESIQTIRKLKALGIGIYFEKENINTLTEKSELMITVLSSITQGESEDFSGNNRWSIIKRFQDGTYIIGTPAYGYINDEDDGSSDTASMIAQRYADSDSRVEFYSQTNLGVSAARNYGLKKRRGKEFSSLIQMIPLNFICWKNVMYSIENSVS